MTCILAAVLCYKPRGRRDSLLAHRALRRSAVSQHEMLKNLEFGGVKTQAMNPIIAVIIGIVCLIVGALGGAVLFFSLLSSALRPVWAFWIDILLVPLRLGKKLLRKLEFFSKKGFSFLQKWFTIMGTPKQDC